MATIPNTLQTTVMEQVKPEIDGGRDPVKRIIRETPEVTAAIFKESHTTIVAILRYKIYDEKIRKKHLCIMQTMIVILVHFHFQKTLDMFTPSILGEDQSSF